MSALKDLGKRLAALLEEDAWNHIESFINDAEAENEALKQQVEQGKRDAERYRQMKLLHDDPDGGIGVCEYEEGRDEWLFVTQDLSKYIDAAIAAPK